MSQADADACIAPKGKNTGARPAVVVFPGGGYQILAIDLEGTEVCDWLNSIGVTCVLVKYRVPDTGPVSQVARSPAGCTARGGDGAATCGGVAIDPKRVGVLGFSAGAHLSAALSTHYDTAALRSRRRRGQAELPSGLCGDCLSRLPGAGGSEYGAEPGDSVRRRIRRPRSSCRPRTIRCTSRMR